MAKDFIRVWSEEDVRVLTRSLLIVGESSSECGHCQALGLDFANVQTCPNCQTRFQYITSRLAGGGASDRYFWIKRIVSKRPELKLIDYDDFQKTMARIKASEFFKEK